MSCGGWSDGEVNDEIREICAHEMFVGALSTALGVEAGGLTFTPTSVRQQVVSGMHYEITGSHGNRAATVLVWYQAWTGGVKSCEVIALTAP